MLREGTHPPIYCHYDGVKLIEATREYSVGFSRETGEQIPNFIEEYLMCPRDTQWPIVDSSHDRWAKMESIYPNTYWWKLVQGLE